MIVSSHLKSQVLEDLNDSQFKKRKKKVENIIIFNPDGDSDYEKENVQETINGVFESLLTIIKSSEDSILEKR